MPPSPLRVPSPRAVDRNGRKVSLAVHTKLPPVLPSPAPTPKRWRSVPSLEAFPLPSPIYSPGQPRRQWPHSPGRRIFNPISPSPQRRSQPSWVPEAQEEPNCLIDLLEDPAFEQDLVRTVFRDATPEHDQESSGDSPIGLAPVLHAARAAGAFRGRRRRQQEDEQLALSDQAGQPKPPETREQQNALDRHSILRGSVSDGAIPVRVSAPIVTFEPIPGAQPSPSQRSSKEETPGEHTRSSHVPSSHALPQSLHPRPRRSASLGTKAFERMLDENLVPTKYEIEQRSKERELSQLELDERLQSLRDMLRKADVMDRVIDLFRKFDVDQNGEVRASALHDVRST